MFGYSILRTRLDNTDCWAFPSQHVSLFNIESFTFVFLSEMEDNSARS